MKAPRVSMLVINSVWGTQEEDTQNRNTTKYVLDTTMCKHRHDPSHKQLEAKTNRTSPPCGTQKNVDNNTFYLSSMTAVTIGGGETAYPSGVDDQFTWG
jgi:hypothetical protein